MIALNNSADLLKQQKWLIYEVEECQLLLHSIANKEDTETRNISLLKKATIVREAVLHLKDQLMYQRN